MRATGIATRETDGGLHVFVSHHFWHADRAEKSLRISRLVVPDVDALLTGQFTGDPHAWEVIFESSPRIAFDPADPSPFNTDHSGGRIVFASDGRLLVGIGDHRYDGVTVPRIASQDDTSSYGKVLRIDPDSQEVTVHALGLRNPQGLAFDREGNLWATDHGPDGGDELNAIVAGANYGWPFATLGTDYGTLRWPLSRRQGRHDGFARPLYSWTPSIGISSVIQVQREPHAWDGDLLVASLVGRTLYRVRVTGGRVAFAEPIPIGERIRDLVQLNDGSFLIWVDSGRFIELRAVAGEPYGLPVPLTVSEKQQGLASVLSQCGACHGFDEATPATRAPSLHGVAGRRIGDSAYPGYSDALKARGGVWDHAALRAFLTDPQSFAAGTHMPAVPMEPGTVAAVVGYLKRLD